MKINDILMKEYITEVYNMINHGKSVDEVYEDLNNSLSFQKDMEQKKQLFGYMGGKIRLSSQIVKFIPEHKVYVEPFFGSGQVMFKKGYKNVKNNDNYREVINDFDKNLINLYIQIKENPNELIDELESFWYSEFQHKISKTNSEYFTNQNNIQKQQMYLFNILSGFGGSLDQGFQYSKNGSNHSITFLNKIQEIKQYHERLKGVYIFNKNYKELIKKFDSKDTFFYFDPPYKNTQKYKVNDIDYVEFQNVLKTIKGKWMVSHYYDDYIKEYFNGYKIEHINHVRSISKQKDGKRPNKKVNEIIIMNYDIENEEKFLK